MAAHVGAPIGVERALAFRPELHVGGARDLVGSKLERLSDDLGQRKKLVADSPWKWPGFMPTCQRSCRNAALSFARFCPRLGEAPEDLKPDSRVPGRRPHAPRRALRAPSREAETAISHNLEGQPRTLVRRVVSV